MVNWAQKSSKEPPALYLQINTHTWWEVNRKRNAQDRSAQDVRKETGGLAAVYALKTGRPTKPGEPARKNIPDCTNIRGCH